VKIAILSHYPKSYSTSRLREACKERGHRVRVLETTNFLLQVRQGLPEVWYKGLPLTPDNALIPRIGCNSVFGATAVVRHFEQSGIYTVQSSRGISSAHDKFRTMQDLSRHHIPIPPTVFVFNPTEVEAAIDFLGGAPVVIKFLRGTQGSGVMLAEDKNVATSIVQALQATDHRVLLQKFIAESFGQDIRAFVVGDQVVAAMRRTARAGEFRSNIHLGATVERVLLDDVVADAAVRAAQLLGLGVAGVDILESDDGPLIIEVNASPGLEGIERATQLDIAGEIIEHVEQRSKLPHIDLHERLIVGTSFQCAEVCVKKSAKNKSWVLSELLGHHRDLHVLGVKRGQEHIALPELTFTVERGDRLVLFGQKNTLTVLSEELGVL
jgi:ribosomal protein S6--L-glutamate ligase